MVFYDFNGYLFLRLVINAFYHITERTFTDNFTDFVPEPDLVSLLEPVVALIIVETIVDQAFKLRWLVLIRFRGEEINFFIFFHLSPLISC